MSYVLNYAKPETWYVHQQGYSGSRRSWRFGDRRIDVLDEPKGKPATLAVHRFADEHTRNAFLTKLSKTLHYKAFLLQAKAKPPRSLPKPEIVAHATPAKKPARKTSTKKPAPKRPKRAPVPRASRWNGDAAELVARVRQATDALRALSADVTAKIARPASAATMKALAKACPDGVPASLATIYALADGFSVEWSGDADVVFEWLGAKQALAAWKLEQKYKDPEARRAILPIVAQYDGCLVGLDTRRFSDGEYPVVFFERLEDEPRGVAKNAGAFLEEVVANAFTHPNIPDVAHRKAAKTAKRLARLLSKARE